MSILKRQLLKRCSSPSGTYLLACWDCARQWMLWSTAVGCSVPVGCLLAFYLRPARNCGPSLSQLWGHKCATF